MSFQLFAKSQPFARTQAIYRDSNGPVGSVKHAAGMSRRFTGGTR
jgi:hypothetical protein